SSSGSSPCRGCSSGDCLRGSPISIRLVSGRLGFRHHPSVLVLFPFPVRVFLPAFSDYPVGTDMLTSGLNNGRRMLPLAVGLILLTTAALADTVIVSGKITQSPADAGATATNSSLNAIAFNDDYTVTLKFSGSILGPGFYALNSATLQFDDLAA